MFSPNNTNNPSRYPCSFRFVPSSMLSGPAIASDLAKSSAKGLKQLSKNNLWNQIKRVVL